MNEENYLIKDTFTSEHYCNICKRKVREDHKKISPNCEGKITRTIKKRKVRVGFSMAVSKNGVFDGFLTADTKINLFKKAELNGFTMCGTKTFKQMFPLEEWSIFEQYKDLFQRKHVFHTATLLLQHPQRDICNPLRSTWYAQKIPGVHQFESNPFKVGRIAYHLNDCFGNPHRRCVFL